MARLTRPITPLVLKSSTVRRLWFRGSAACHADRITAKRGVQIVDDYIECTVSAEIFSTTASTLHSSTPAMPRHSGMVGERRNPSRRLVRP